MQNDKISIQDLANYRPTAAYVGATWAVLCLGVLAFLFGLWNAAGLVLSEKGYYVAVMALGLYSAISLQKTIRDKAEDIPTSTLYYMISWAAFGLSVALMIVGLFNADKLVFTEKSFYMMAFALSAFAAITVQKNTRDEAFVKKSQSNMVASGFDPVILNKTSQKTIETTGKPLSGLLNSKSKPEAVD